MTPPTLRKIILLAVWLPALIYVGALLWPWLSNVPVPNKAARNFTVENPLSLFSIAMFVYVALTLSIPRWRTHASCQGIMLATFLMGVLHQLVSYGTASASGAFFFLCTYAALIDRDPATKAERLINSRRAQSPTRSL